MNTKQKTHFSALIFLSLLTIGLVLFYFAGCVVVPKDYLVVSGRNDQEIQRSPASCVPGSELPGPGQTAAGLDPDHFSILSWNSHRSSGHGWGGDLVSIGGAVDIILLQEASLESVLDTQTDLFASDWLMATAFEFDKQEIGILSAARVPAYGYCATKEVEPWLRIPKIGLAVTYPLAGLETRLLVINIHMVNFTLTTDTLRHQIAALTEIIKDHRGPVVVAGDFNTWSREREVLVHQKMAELGLQPVGFQPDNRVEFFNHKVDNVFYRGLQVKQSLSHQVETSDHNPLEVHFAFVERAAG